MTAPMLSEEMEQKLAKLCDRSAFYQALGRSPAEVSSALEVISLGSSCGVKMTLRRMGLDQANMPFDWIRSSGQGILHWMQNGFADYFNVPFNRVEVTFRDLNMTVYRSSTHSFWHDNIEEPMTWQTLQRRVQRFEGLAKDSEHRPARALLFVRAICTTEEITGAEALFNALQQRFGRNGRQVFLLLVIEDQGLVGPILHSSYPNLLFWVQPLATGPLATTGDAPGPYEAAVAFACRRILKDPAALMPGGVPGAGMWPQVTSASEIFQIGSQLKARGLRDSECGLFCGVVKRKNALETTLMAAFEGFEHREVACAA